MYRSKCLKKKIFLNSPQIIHASSKINIAFSQILKYFYSAYKKFIIYNTYNNLTFKI